MPFELRLDVALAARLGRMQQVPALRRHAVAAQFVEAGRAPDVGGDAEVRLEQFGGRDHLAQDRAAAHQLHARPFFPVSPPSSADTAP